MRLSPLNARRLRNFRRNGRAFWSLVIFLLLFLLSLFAEVIANDRPVLVKYRGDYYFPAYNFYTDKTFGGDLGTRALYGESDMECLIVTGGHEDCLWEDPEPILQEARDSGTVNGEEIERGWMLWPPIPYSYHTINNVGTAPSAPNSAHWLGTDAFSRDVVARIIYGFRVSVGFALIVSFFGSVIGIAAGAVQGYFGGRTDLIFQRLLEIWGAMPGLYIIIIMSAILGRSFGLLAVITIILGWPALTGVVRAEFLRTRNFEYVRAARALGVRDRVIMFRHVLPNAMVATLTMLPFIVTGAISELAALDYLGYGLPQSWPSLGELALQGKEHTSSPWLGLSAFFTFAVMLSLLVFIFEGVRDAFDPRKTFR